MKYKILILLIIFTLLLCNGVYAEPKFHYSYEEALDMALKNSYEYKSKDMAISKAYNNFEKLEKAGPKEVKFNIGNFKRFILDQVEPYVDIEKAYSSYQKTILDKQNTKINIDLKLRSLIISVLKAEMALEEAKTNEKSLEKELELLEIRLKQSLITKQEYKNKKSEIESKIIDLEKAQEALNNAYYELNTLLGRKNEKDIFITLEDRVMPLDKLNLEQIKKDMIKKDTNLNQLNNQRYAAKVYFDLVEERYLKYDLDRFTDSMKDDIIEIYEEAKESFENADEQYQSALTRFNKTYEDKIKSIEDNFKEIADINEEIKEEQSNTILYKFKYEAKLISKADYDKASNNITLLENKLKKAELDLNMKYAELLIYSDLKKVVLE